MTTTGRRGDAAGSRSRPKVGARPIKSAGGSLNGGADVTDGRCSHPGAAAAVRTPVVGLLLERRLPASRVCGADPVIIRWGCDASCNLVRAWARCAKCGRLGADLQHPSWEDQASVGSHFPRLDWASQGCAYLATTISGLAMIVDKQRIPAGKNPGELGNTFALGE